MFVINEDNSIYVTRGDVLYFSVTATDREIGVQHTFKAGDVLRFKVYGKKDAVSVFMQKDFAVVADTPDVELYLTGEETKFGDVISKPMDYWYEVELNPLTNPQTIVGYDDDGPALFRLFPEGADIGNYVPPEPEEIAVVDEVLDLTSQRPVQNQAVSRAVVQLIGEIKRVAEKCAPDKFITEQFDLYSEEDFNAAIEEIYSGLKANTCRTFAVHIDTNGTEVRRGYWLVEICRFDDIYGYVEMTNENYGKMIRRFCDGKWMPWESESPPAVLDVEYRTTERWNGCVVYTKFINYGNVPDGSMLSAPDGATRIIRYNATFGPFIMPVGESGDPDHAYVFSTFPEIGLRIKHSGIGNYTTYVQMWYIKD